MFYSIIFLLYSWGSLFGVPTLLRVRVVASALFFLAVELQISFSERRLSKTRGIQALLC